MSSSLPQLYIPSVFGISRGLKDLHFSDVFKVELKRKNVKASVSGCINKFYYSKHVRHAVFIHRNIMTNEFISSGSGWVAVIWFSMLTFHSETDTCKTCQTSAKATQVGRLTKCGARSLLRAEEMLLLQI